MQSSFISSKTDPKTQQQFFPMGVWQGRETSKSDSADRVKTNLGNLCHCFGIRETLT